MSLGFLCHDPGRQMPRPDWNSLRKWEIVVALGVFSGLGCGRSSIADPWVHDAGDDTSSGALAESSSADVEPQPRGPCPGITLFDDGFEGENREWTLDSLWSIEESATAYEGDAVLRAHWRDFEVGCDVSEDASLQISVDLRRTDSATLEFWHRGEACSFDELRVEVRDAAGGRTFALMEPVPSPDVWQHYVADLSAVQGASEVSIVVGFDNICGDACGVVWMLDEFRICGLRREG